MLTGGSRIFNVPLLHQIYQLHVPLLVTAFYSRNKYVGQ